MKDLYVVVGSDEDSVWMCIDEMGNEMLTLECAKELLESCCENPEVEEGVWEYRIAKLSFLD